jgi:hypothetical protein
VPYVVDATLDPSGNLPGDHHDRPDVVVHHAYTKDGQRLRLSLSQIYAVEVDLRLRRWIHFSHR